MTTFRARLAKLEQARVATEMTVVMVHGGLPRGDHGHAAAGSLTWLQDVGESDAAFEVRTRAAARAAGAELLVIGGLPG